MNHNTAVAAEFAETILSQEYRRVLDTASQDAASAEYYVDQRRTAELLLVTGYRILPEGGKRIWELRRQAALTELGGTALGAFGTYIHNQGGESSPSALTNDDLVPPSHLIIRTNSQIIGLGKIHQEPIDFMDDALDLLDAKNDTAKGPGNFASTLKFFTDKFREFPSSHLDPIQIKQVVDKCMDGFLDVSQADRPNFIEMTNLYFTVRALPKGTFDKKHTEDIMGHSLEQLPTYHAKTLAILIGCMSKLDLSGTGESAATLIDLALRKSPTMERTTSMVQVLKAIANLPASPAAERALNTFLQVRNNLEQPQDLEGLDTINHALVHIVQNVIDDPELSVQAKSLAEQCAGLSLRIVQQKDRDDNTTTEELLHLKNTVRRIINNYNQI